MGSSVSSVQSLSRVRLFVTPEIAACQASLSITSSQSFLKFMSIESVMLSNHLIPCRPLLLTLSIFPRIRVFFFFFCHIRMMGFIFSFHFQIFYDCVCQFYNCNYNYTTYKILAFYIRLLITTSFMIMEFYLGLK